MSTERRYIFDGERLQERRKDKGLTQKQFGELIGVSAKTISSYEGDRMSPQSNKLPQIAKELDISLDYLFGLTDDDVPVTRKNYIPLPRDYTPEFKDEVMNQIELLQYKYGYKKPK